MKMTHITIRCSALLMLLLSTFSCDSKRSDSNQDKTALICMDNDWVKDSVGCLHLRSLALADSLVVANKLLEKSSNDFITVFGIPNKEVEHKDKVALIYYMSSVCKDGLPIENADKCWVEFIFKNDRLEAIPVAYFIE